MALGAPECTCSGDPRAELLRSRLPDLMRQHKNHVAVLVDGHEIILLHVRPRLTSAKRRSTAAARRTVLVPIPPTRSRMAGPSRHQRQRARASVDRSPPTGARSRLAAARLSSAASSGPGASDARSGRTTCSTTMDRTYIRPPTVSGLRRSTPSGRITPAVGVVERGRVLSCRADVPVASWPPDDAGVGRA